MTFWDEDKQTYNSWKKLTLVYNKTNQQLYELSRHKLAKRPLISAWCPSFPPPAQYPINSREDVRDSSGVYFGSYDKPIDLSY